MARTGLTARPVGITHASSVFRRSRGLQTYLTSKRFLLLPVLRCLVWSIPGVRFLF